MSGTKNSAGLVALLLIPTPFAKSLPIVYRVGSKKSLILHYNQPLLVLATRHGLLSPKQNDLFMAAATSFHYIPLDDRLVCPSLQSSLKTGLRFLADLNPCQVGYWYSFVHFLKS